MLPVNGSSRSFIPPPPAAPPPKRLPPPAVYLSAFRRDLTRLSNRIREAETALREGAGPSERISLLEIAANEADSFRLTVDAAAVDLSTLAEREA